PLRQPACTKGARRAPVASLLRDACRLLLAASASVATSEFRRRRRYRYRSLPGTGTVGHTRLSASAEGTPRGYPWGREGWTRPRRAPGDGALPRRDGCLPRRRPALRDLAPRRLFPPARVPLRTAASRASGAFPAHAPGRRRRAAPGSAR